MYASFHRPMRALILALATATVALAADAPPPADSGRGAEQPTTPSTFVPDSSVALERLALAEKLERASEWIKAAEVYQELLESYRDRVVPSGPDDPTLYVNVADRVLRQLSRWPAEGLAVYNGRYEPTAETLLTQAEDANALRAITDRYLLTRAGMTAAGRLMQHWWDQGQPGIAARFAERLASLLPADHPQRPMLLFQSGLCWHLAGNADRARLLADQLKKDHAQAVGSIAGQEMVLSTALGDALGSAPAVARAADSWPSFGGSPQRSSTPEGLGRPDALLFSVDIVAPVRASDQFNGRIAPQRARDDLNQTLNIIPVYDGRELFFQDGTNLYGVSLDGGMKLPGWPSVSVPITNSGASPQPSLQALAVTDDSIVTVLSDMSQTVWAGVAPGASSDDNSALVCFDRRNSKVRWRVTPTSLGAALPALKSLQIVSAPLAVGSQVFVTARGGRNAQFNDIYVLCFALANGKLQWSSYVASGPNANLVYVQEGPMPAETGLPQLSWNSGRVVIVTNVGAIAALDAADGLPAWLRLYARSEQPGMRMLMGGMVRRLGGPMRTPRISAASPAAIAGGHVFALPVDATHLLVLDEADGRVLKRIPLSSIGMVDTLLAVRGRQLVLTGERIATVLDWQTAGEDGSEQTDAINWTMDFPGAALRGRPFLTADSLFLATDDRLLRVGAEHWKIEQTMPRHPATWDSSQGPGNMLVTSEHVVIATAKKVNVYTNLAAITARYDRDIAADPTSPEPLVRYGELLFAAGQNDLALARFKAALALATAPGAKTEPRERLFSAVLGCTQRLSATDVTSSSASTFLQIARDAALTPEHLAQYHLAGAMLALRAEAGATALDHLQEILNDARQRSAIVRDTDQTSRPAGQIARRTIAQAIDRYGIAIYQGVEQKLQQQLAAAQNARDPAALLELFRRYPNSPSAPSALFVAGRLYEDQHKLTEAAATYRTLIQEFPTHADAAVFIEAFARAYAAIPGRTHIAAARLAQAAVILNDPSTIDSIRLPDGRIIERGPFSKVAAALKQAAGIQAGQSLPDLQLPPAGTAAYAHARPLDIAADRILPTIPGCQTDYHRCVLVTPERELLVLNAAGKILARTPAAELLGQAGQVDIAWASESILLVRSAGQLAGIDMATGKVAWTCVIDKLPSVEPMEEDAVAQVESDAADGPVLDPRVRAAILRKQMVVGPGGMVIAPRAPMAAAARLAAPPAADGGDGSITDLAIVSGRVVLGTNTGRMVALNAGSGEILWQLQLGNGRIGRVDATDEFAAAKLDAAPARIVGVDMATGQSIFRRTHADDVIYNLVLGDDGRLIYTLQNRVVCKDLFDPSDRMLFTARLESPSGFRLQDDRDQLLLTDDAIIATTDNGTYVQMFSPLTGKPIAPGSKEAGAQRPPVVLAAPNRAMGPPRPSRTRLVRADPYIYAYNLGAIRALNVQRREAPERMLPRGVSNLSQVVPGLMHLVAIEQPFQQADTPSIPFISIYAFSRLQGATSESGKLEQVVTLKQDSGITSYQLVEGGLYLTTADHHLVYYGNRP